MIIARLQRLFITLLAIVTVIFVAVRLVPGDPVLVLLGDYATPESVAALSQQMGLDRPIWEQYLHFLGQLAQGQLGYSYRNRVPATELIAAQYPFTLHLATISFLLALLLGVVVGLLAARTRGTRWDLGLMGISTFWMSVPFFWLGLLLLLLFSIQIPLFPLAGGGSLSDPLDLLRYLVLPALAVALRQAAIIARLTRSAVLDVLAEDYVRTAWAKGLSARPILIRHVLRNAFLPIISIASLELIALLGGSMIIEIVFSRPGIGSLFIQSVIARDYPMVQACVLLFGVIATSINFVADLAYGVADPRIRVR